MNEIDLFSMIGIFISGFSRVFAVLAILIAGTYVLVKFIGPKIDASAAASGALDEATLQKVIAEAISKATDGKGVPSSITKI